MFRVAVGVWAIQPSEFWMMTMREFWWLFDARKPVKLHAGGLTDKDMKELHDRLTIEREKYGL